MLTTEGQKQKARLLAKIRRVLASEEMTADGQALFQQCASILDVAKTDGEVLAALTEGKALLESVILNMMPRPERLS
jgi:hypothetical protein